ncbi:MAG: hypothetical protein IIC02_04505 [Planctomycetes bacterium]|nr:hypothetical protein [Planctomycetota bacterium]
MIWKVCCGHSLGLALIVSASAQTPPEDQPPSEPVAESFGDLSARAAVREGNAKLLEGDAVTALDAYSHAEELRPDAPQIPFAQGLAHLAQKDFDAARDAFRAVAASDNERLANDALYSLGASYHLEAMENSENPQQAVEKLESAMARYREVLASAPNHAAARESDYKAAAMRRQLKQLLEQQQQQDQQGDQEEQEEDQQQSDQEQQEGDRQQSDDEQQQSSEEQQQKEGDQQQQSGDESNDQSEEEKQQQAQKSEEEEISREQAERQLREMMQAIRERQKKRKSNVRKVRLPPVERDW